MFRNPLCANLIFFNLYILVNLEFKTTDSEIDTANSNLELISLSHSASQILQKRNKHQAAAVNCMFQMEMLLNINKQNLPGVRTSQIHNNPSMQFIHLGT